MNFKPARDLILVEPDKADAQSAGGLIIPESYQKAAGQGKIVAVGRFSDERDNYCPGQRVIFPEYGGLPMKMNGGTYKLLRVSEIFGVVL